MVVNCVRLPIACIDTAWRRLLLTGEWRPLIDCSTMYSSLEQVSSSSTVDVHRVAGCCVCSTTVWSAWSECWNDSRQSSDTYFENSHFTNLKNLKKIREFLRSFDTFDFLTDQSTTFLRATAVPAGTAVARISYGDYVCLSVWGATTRYRIKPR